MGPLRQFGPTRGPPVPGVLACHGEGSPDRRRDGVGGGHRVIGEDRPDHAVLIDDLDDIIVYDVVVDSGAVRQRVRRCQLRGERAGRLLLRFGLFLVSDRDLLIEDVEAVRG